MNRHEFDVRYSESQIRRSTWAYVRISVRRQMNWTGWVAVVVLPVLCAWLFLFDPTSIWVWVLPVIIGSLAVFLAMAWHNYIRDSLERLSHMKTPVARVVADDESLSIASDLGSSVLPWSAFTDCFDGPGALYLKAGKSAMLNLPTEGVDERALQFIRERIGATAEALNRRA